MFVSTCNVCTKERIKPQQKYLYRCLFPAFKQLRVPDDGWIGSTIAVCDVKFRFENDYWLWRWCRCKYFGTFCAQSQRQSWCTLPYQLQLNDIWLDGMGLPEFQCALFTIERNDTRRCRLFDVAPLWPKSRRAKSRFGSSKPNFLNNIHENVSRGSIIKSSFFYL